MVTVIDFNCTKPNNILCTKYKTCFQQVTIPKVPTYSCCKNTNSVNHRYIHQGITIKGL